MEGGTLPVIHGDCLEVMKRMDAKSVDVIVTDLPFGTTQNSWDVIIPFDKLWEQYNRIRKKNTPIVLFGQGMFTAKLMMSNFTMWRYNLIWDKGDRPTGFLNAKRMPLRSHEDILVFYESLPTFNPQMWEGNSPTHSRGSKNKNLNNNYGKFESTPTVDYGNKKFPISILRFPKPHPPIHPTQKPVALLEYLIRTYTNENDTVLDSCIGSGTTAVACIRSNRKFIGIEKEEKYFKMANEEIKKEY